MKPLSTDVRATDKYGEFVAQVDAATKGAGINLLINNSGVFTKQNNDTLSQLNKDDLLYHFEVNTIAPIMITQVCAKKAFIQLNIVMCAFTGF